MLLNKLAKGGLSALDKNRRSKGRNEGRKEGEILRGNTTGNKEVSDD